MSSKSHHGLLKRVPGKRGGGFKPDLTSPSICSMRLKDPGDALLFSFQRYCAETTAICA